MPDDNQKIDLEDEEPIESSFVVEDDEEEWGGIASEGEDDEEEEGEESFDGEEGDSAEPLEWDDLFANAEGALDGADKAEASFVTVDEDDEDSEGDDEEEEIEIITEQPSAKSAKGKSKAPVKRSKSTSFRVSSRSIADLAFLSVLDRVIDEVSSEEETEGKPVKEARMTTNKKKATNFFTTANVKK